MTSSATVERVREYYRDVQPFYNVLWTEPRTLSMNYGLWESDTRSHAEALANQNKLIEELLQPAPGHRVLESGCGVGGACIWFAERHPITVVGITLCPNQAEQATRHAKERGLTNRVRFAVMDFTRTAFPNASFARIYASESVCYAERKADFINEAFRLLEPAGRLVVVDGFAKTMQLSDSDRQKYEEWCRGWAVPNLATVDGFAEDLRRAGFADISFRDLTAEIHRSSRRIRWFGLVAFPILSGLQVVRVATRAQVGNARSCIRQYDLVHGGIWGLGVFSATKPVASGQWSVISGQ